MSSDYTRLLEHIVGQHFGSAVGVRPPCPAHKTLLTHLPCLQQVAAILINRGPLSLPHLVRLSNLPSPLIEQSLMVLSLHSLLWHFIPETDGQLEDEVYEINPANIYLRMRVGRCVDMVEEWEGGGDEGKSVGSALERLRRKGMSRGYELVEEAGGMMWRKKQTEMLAKGNGDGAAMDTESESGQIESLADGELAFRRVRGGIGADPNCRCAAKQSCPDRLARI